MVFAEYEFPITKDWYRVAVIGWVTSEEDHLGNVQMLYAAVEPPTDSTMPQVRLDVPLLPLAYKFFSGT
jgi:hypothetical protein